MLPRPSKVPSGLDINTFLIAQGEPSDDDDSDDEGFDEDFDMDQDFEENTKALLAFAEEYKD